MKFKKRILAPVSLPPPFYGSNISSQNIVTSSTINEEFDLDVYKISYNKSSQKVGKLEIKKVFLIIRNFWAMVSKSFKKYDLVYYVPAVKGFAFYRDFLLLFPLKISNKNILIHIRGLGIKEQAEKNRIHRFFYIWFFKNTEVICLSERLIADISNVHKGKIHIVNNAIKPIQHPETKRKNDVPIILFLSNLRETKGIFTLLEACSILIKRDVNFKVRLVGEPRGNNMPEIMNFISKHNLSKNITSIAPAFDKEKEMAYQNADIFVFPTFFETWGLVINEAMNAGLPVISTNVGSIPLIIDDGETGYIVEPRNAIALADKMEILLLDEKLREKMGLKGQEKFYENYTLDILEKNMIEVFNKTINKCNN